MKSVSSQLFDLTRRGFLVSGAAAITCVRSLAATPSCSLAAEQEEGPYYVEAAKFRSNITEGKRGVPVTLRVALVNAKTCAPLSNAAFDIWHCDAEGIYSGFTSNSGNGPGGPGGGRPPRFGPGGPPPPQGPPPNGGPDDFGPGMPPPGFGPGGPGRGGARKIDETRFLRGMQISNREGVVEFATLYPGWYSGRAIHIHMKVHLGGEQAAETYQGGHVSHTGQLFFPEDVTEKISKAEPYAKRLSVHRTTQEEDMVFTSQHGAGTVVKLERLKKGSDLDGFVATATLAIDPDATPRGVGVGGRRGPGGPPPSNR